jgi:hypothetical protein
MVREDDNAFFGVLIGVALLIPLVLTLSNGWSWWYSPFAAVLLAASAALRKYLIVRREQTSLAKPLEPPPRRETPASPAQDAISEVDLPTNTPDYRMLFSATAMWQTTTESNQSSHGNPGALAKQAIIERAAAVIRDAFPSDSAITMVRLAALLGEWQSDPTGQVRACAKEVKLAIRDEDADRIRALSDLRKQSQMWEQEREHERNVREYLASDVLTTSGRALVWWMARHMDNIEGTVALIGHLSRLSAASQDRDDMGAVMPHLVATQSPMRDSEDRAMASTRDLLNQLFPDSYDQRAFFARQLAQAAEKCGQDRYGRRLREMFDVQDVRESPPDTDEPTSA